MQCTGKRLVVFGLLMMIGAGVAQAAPIYVKMTGSDAADGLTWGTAKKTIGAGVTAALAGGNERVVVSNGAYTVSASITVNTALRVEAFDPDPAQTIVRRTANSNPIFRIEHADAVVHGFMIENGNTDGGNAKVTSGILSGCVVRNGTSSLYGPGVWMLGGMVTNCAIYGNTLPGGHGSAIGGAGVYMTGGLLVDSAISDNQITILRSGGGVYANGGTIDRCLISGNHAAQHGGGVYLTGGAILRNSLVVANEARQEAGGVYVHIGRVESCTSVRNLGAGYSGGLYLTANGVGVNTIVADNYGASIALRNLSNNGGTVSNSLARPLPAGFNNLNADPEFVDPDGGDFRLRAGSPALDAGATLGWMTGARDRDGADRITGLSPDLGAFESAATNAGPLRVNFISDTRRITAPDDVVFMACVAGDSLSGLQYYWDFGNGTTNGAGLAGVTNSYNASGIYTVALTVSNSLAQGASVAKSRQVVAGPLSLYVAPDGASIPPYGDWDSALSDIHWAFEHAGPGDTIYLAGRTYALKRPLMFAGQQVAIKGGYEAAGGTGPGARDRERWPTRLTRDPAIQGMRLLTIESAADSTFEELALEGGRSFYLLGHIAGSGLSVLDSTGLEFVRCRIRNNNSTIWGGGLYGINSTAVFRSGEISFNTLHGNAWDQSLYGGGAYLSGGAWTFQDTVFGGNNTDRVRVGSGLDNNRENLLGGAIYAASGTHTVSNCAFYGNNGSRPYSSTTANHDRHGGGLYVNGGSVAVANSTFVHNNNEGVRRNGGTLTLKNSILWDNGGNDVVGSATVSSCSVASGSFVGSNGNSSADPLFERGLYLGAASLCRDAGSAAASDFGLSAYTTSTNGAADTGVVDLGYHYAAGLSPDYAGLYVAEDGDDTRAGTTPATALRTITRALQLAHDGTRVHVGPGIYTASTGETFPLVVGRPGLHLIGAGFGQTTLNADGVDQVVTIKGIPVDGRLEGVTVTGGSVYRNYGAGIGIWQSRITLEGCRVMGNTLLRPSLGIFWGSEYGAGIGSCLATVSMIDCAVVSNTVNCNAWDGSAMGGGIGIREGAWSVKRSVVAFNVAAGDSRAYNYGAGLLIDGGTHRFENLLLTSNRCNKVGSQYIRAYAGDGAYLFNGARVSFVNVTVAHNQGQGIYSEWTGTYPPAACTVSNSIAWGNRVDVLGKNTSNLPMQITYAIGVTGTATVAWSDVQEVHADAGNLQVDPLFAAFGDYHLRSKTGRWTPGGWVRDKTHSPCIDAGDRRTPVGDEPYPNGNRVNLGAYGGTAQSAMSLASGTMLLLR